MITDFDKILNELSYKVKDGIPNLKNEQHLIKLWDVLKECQWPIDSRVELIRNLTDINFIGGDLVEVSPAYDHGEITSLAAASILLDFICLLKSEKIIPKK